MKYYVFNKVVRLRGFIKPVLNTFASLILSSLTFNAMAAPTSEALPNSLSLKSMVDIEQSGAGLSEPSGLTFSKDKKALWTVSDDSPSLFKINLNGDVIGNETINISDLDEQEGIALSLDATHLYTVNEADNAIIKVNIANKAISQKVYLKKIPGYSQMALALAHHFDASSGSNKGLEGISLHPNSGNIFLIKESGLLIELSADLGQIIRYHELSFADDYSGISFENADHNRVWIISDDSKKIYLFDLETVTVKASLKLKKSSGKSYDSAEGVAYDPTAQELYIVTDNKQKLRRYKVNY